MYENRLGVVSNCWKLQLDAGERLDSLISQASDAGFRFVELRQACLGECENPETRLPNADALASLAAQFPEITFDLAVELPIFSRSISAVSSDVRVLLDAAQALSDSGQANDQVGISRPPHLRIVDLDSKVVPPAGIECAEGDVSESSFYLDDVMTSLRLLQDELSSGILSVEHSFQPWNGFRQLFEAVRLEGCDAKIVTPSLKLCYDPCNLWLSGDGPTANKITSTLPINWLSMVHLKQRRDGGISSRLEAGDVDWLQHLRILNQAGYTGPLLFEIESSKDVWRCLADSQRYLAELVTS